MVERSQANNPNDTDSGRSRRGTSRRELLIAGGSGALGVALASAPAASAYSPYGRRHRHRSGPQEVLNVAATIEVLTTIVTTTALQKGVVPSAGINTVSAAAREELDHYEVLTARFGGRAATHRIWVPDGLFASATDLFTALVVGEQICINLYLVATTVWAQAGSPFLARVGAELVGNEGVHRALARQALGLEPNDRAFMKYNQVDQADGPGSGMAGFTHAQDAIKAFETDAGIGFGKMGTAPGAFYDFNTVRQNTPNPSFVNTLEPR
jgi:hypothetical protein